MPCTTSKHHRRKLSVSSLLTAALAIASVHGQALAEKVSYESQDNAQKLKISGRFYGDFRLSLNSVDDQPIQDGLSVEDNASRLGLKGAVQSGGLKMIYHYQLGLRTDTTTPAGDSGLSTRFAWAGFQGSAGKLIYGTISMPYKMAGLKLDPFYDSSAGRGFVLANHGLSRLANGFSANGLVYQSPNLAGVVFDLAAVIDDSDADSHAINYGLSYSQKGNKIGVQYIDLGDSAVVAASAGLESAIRIYAEARIKAVKLGLSLEQVEPLVGDTQDFAYLSAQWAVTGKWSLVGAVGYVDAAGLAGDGRSVSIMAKNKILKGTELVGLFSSVSGDNGASDRNVVSVGVSHMIGWDF